MVAKIRTPVSLRIGSQANCHIMVVEISIVAPGLKFSKCYYSFIYDRMESSVYMLVYTNIYGLDNSRHVTSFKKWTITLSLKQDMFRSFNDHLQL